MAGRDAPPGDHHHAQRRGGSEERLDHLLDSAVAEVNGDPDARVTTEDPEADAVRARDRRMTEAFRRLGCGEAE